MTPAPPGAPEGDTLWQTRTANILKSQQALPAAPSTVRSLVCHLLSMTIFGAYFPYSDNRFNGSRAIHTHVDRRTERDIIFYMYISDYETLKSKPIQDINCMGDRERDVAAVAFGVALSQRRSPRPNANDRIRVPPVVLLGHCVS
ncbi:hypothetical protein EVAR_78702_1 [Eumeta japonica]|uniref:Uncharacterized protein n=1 Tax=Eumeta variegata TaxID=151549 RepID=A0A4C1T1V8_EUMVA|nr:hypothetical protein EVAR_78702_1 [Eumeta japonica]